MTDAAGFTSEDKVAFLANEGTSTSPSPRGRYSSPFFAASTAAEVCHGR